MVRASADAGAGTKLRYWMGVDFGQANDYTAVSVIERIHPSGGLHVRYLRRPPLRTSYEKIAAGVVERLEELEPVGAFGERADIGLVVDGTGVGRAVVDMLRAEIIGMGVDGPRVQLWPVTVTGGQRVTRNGPYLGVPKRDLINAAVIALQNGLLKIGVEVPGQVGLVEELLNYRVRINTRTGHDTYEPWREGQHDDLLFSVALACWAWSFSTPAKLERGA